MAEKTDTQIATQMAAQTDVSQAEGNQEPGAAGTHTETKSEPLTTEAIEKIIQSRVDKATADLGKTIASLKKDNEKLKKDSLSAEELKQFEMSEKEKELAEREQTLHDRENRLFAIKAIKEIGLDDGSEKSLLLVDFVMSDSEDRITEKVKAFNDLVQAFVAAKVDEKFKSIGRTPSGASSATETKTESSVAESLGKRRAEQNKKSTDVLNYYLGGKR